MKMPICIYDIRPLCSIELYCILLANCFVKQQHPYFNRFKKLVINTTRSDIGSKTHFKPLYISYPICCEHFDNTHYVDPAHTSLVPQTIPTIFSSVITNTPQMIAELHLRRCSWRVCAAIACHNTTHNSYVWFFSFFSNENDGDRYVLIVSSIKVMYHKGGRTYVLSQILSVTHPLSR